MPTGLEAVAWAREVERLGAGEIVLTSMDADGTQNGYDLEMTRAVVDAVEIPVVASGGAGSPEHLRAVLAEAGASAALAASIFHYGEYSIAETKDYLASHGVPVRRVAAATRPRHAWPRLPPVAKSVLRYPVRRPDRNPSRKSTESTVSSIRRYVPAVLASPERISRSPSPWRRPSKPTVDAMPNEPEANKLFRMVMKYKGSDLHLKVGLRPRHAAGRRAPADADARR